MNVCLGKSHVLELPRKNLQPSTPSLPSESDDDAFFRSRRKSCVNVEDVLTNYLHDDSDSLASLDQWPCLKLTFIKLNTPLPANAACKRLFSAAGRISAPIAPRRGHISDKHFEQQLLAYGNKHLM